MLTGRGIDNPDTYLAGLKILKLGEILKLVDEYQEMMLKND